MRDERPTCQAPLLSRGEHMLCASKKSKDAEFLLKTLRGIEWINLVFPDVNMLVHVNVNVPEKV